MRLFNFNKKKKHKNLSENSNRINIAGINNSISCNKINVNVNGNNNLINADDDITVAKIPQTLISVIGNNNNVVIKRGVKISNNFTLQIVGDNNNIDIDENVLIVDNLLVQIIEKCNNAKISIGKNTTFWNTTIQSNDINSSVVIGEDCMFSYNTSVLNCDGHAIFQNGILINQGKELIIGNHCWIGYNSTVYKNAILPNNVIVARNALVTSSLKSNKDNIVVGGIPARIIKENVTWDRSTPNEVIRQAQESLNDTIQ